MHGIITNIYIYKGMEEKVINNITLSITLSKYLKPLIKLLKKFLMLSNDNQCFIVTFNEQIIFYILSCGISKNIFV